MSAALLHRAPIGCVFVMPIRRWIFMVVVDVIPKQSAQVSFVQYDYMIQQFPAAAPYPTLGSSVLPRTAIGGSGWPAAHGLEPLGHLSIELRIAVQDQVSRCALLGEGFSQLLRDPLAGGMFRGVEVEDSPPAVADQEEAVQNPEGGGRNGKEVHGGDRLAMVVQEEQPALPCIPPTVHSGEIPRDGTFGNVKA